MTTRQFALGDRVRTTVDINSVHHGRRFPAGSLGSITREPAGGAGSYGVLFDGDTSRAPLSVFADEIEPAGGAR